MAHDSKQDRRNAIATAATKKTITVEVATDTGTPPADGAATPTPPAPPILVDAGTPPGDMTGTPPAPTPGTPTPGTSDDLIASDPAAGPAYAIMVVQIAAMAGADHEMDALRLIQSLVSNRLCDLQRAKDAADEIRRKAKVDTFTAAYAAMPAEAKAYLTLDAFLAGVVGPAKVARVATPPVRTPGTGTSKLQPVGLSAAWMDLADRIYAAQGSAGKVSVAQIRRMYEAAHPGEERHSDGAIHQSLKRWRPHYTTGTPPAPTPPTPPADAATPPAPTGT